MLQIEMLPAYGGDCLWIEYGSGANIHRVLVDGGPARTYKELNARLEARLGHLSLTDRHFELLVLTHIDADHIGGILKLLINNPLGITFGDIWFNGWRQLSTEATGILGPVQAEQVSALIALQKRPLNRAFEDQPVVVRDSSPLPQFSLPGGLQLTLLSPTLNELRKLRVRWKQEVEKAGLFPGQSAMAFENLRLKNDLPVGVLGSKTDFDLPRLAMSPFRPDTSPANGSSIALLLEYEGHSCLLAGDAFASVLSVSLQRLIEQRGLYRLKLDAFKLSHHGGKHNTSIGLLQQIECPRYLFSTNGNRYGHPDREVVARILRRPADKLSLYFNYVTEYNQVWADPKLQSKFGYDTTYPGDDGDGLNVEL